MATLLTLYTKPGLHQDGALDVAKLATSPLILKTGRAVTAWADPATWAGRLPQAGESVVIPAGRRVLLDVSPPPLKSLQVDGALIFDDRDLSLTADWILVRGELRVGWINQPFMGQAVITLTGNNLRENVWGLGTRFLLVMGGGTIELHGEPRDWRTKLNANAERGAKQVLVEHITDWRPGDRILIGRTGSEAAGADILTITAVHDNVLTLDAPLRHSHCGTLRTLAGDTVDQRATAALLTRNIVICGGATSEQEPTACLRVMPRSHVRLTAVEATRLGGTGLPPIYLHPQVDHDSFVMRNSSLHHNLGLSSTLDRLSLSLLKGNLVYGWT